MILTSFDFSQLAKPLLQPWESQSQSDVDSAPEWEYGLQCLDPKSHRLKYHILNGYLPKFLYEMYHYIAECALSVLLLTADLLLGVH